MCYTAESLYAIPVPSSAILFTYCVVYTIDEIELTQSQGGIHSNIKGEEKKSIRCYLVILSVSLMLCCTTGIFELVAFVMKMNNARVIRENWRLCDDASAPVQLFFNKMP